MDDGYTEISKNTASGTTTTEFFEFLTPGNPYRFAVAAVNAAGEGPRSERITLTASDVAGQPYDVVATFQSSYRSWSFFWADFGGWEIFFWDVRLIMTIFHRFFSDLDGIYPSNTTRVASYFPSA
jgi:hypothetical protein